MSDTRPMSERAMLVAKVRELEAEVERLRRGDEAWEAIEKYLAQIGWMESGDKRVQWRAVVLGFDFIGRAGNPIDAVLELRNQIEKGGA